MATKLDREQRSIVRAIVQESRKIKDPVARRKFKRAAVQTGLVESNLRNLPGGDADSAGWRQERASLYENPTNVKASVTRFRQEFLQHYDPGERASDVAGQVQRPAAQYLGRYQERAPEAKAILAQFKGSPGNVSGSPDRGRYSTPDTLSVTPGVDRSGDRQALLQQYVLQRGDPRALLALGLDLEAAQDTPGSASVVRGRPADREPPARRGRRGGGSGPYDIKELFWQGPDGINIKNGQKVPQGFVSGHDTHVHVAAGPKGVIKLGKLAQRMGLTVREQSHFDPVDPVHAPNSWHYKDRAIDVSGDPKLMAKFAHRVAGMRKR